MSRSRVLLSILAGLALALIPFARYAHFGAGAEAHADHEPRHGGQLGMVEDHHIELVRGRERVEAFVSDAWRRPIEPREGWIAFDAGEPHPLAWRGDRLVGDDVKTARVADVVVVLADGTRLSIGFQ